MLKYLFGTGIIGVLTHGSALLKASREHRFTWRTAIVWASWALSLTLAVGSMIEIRQERRGELEEQPEPTKEEKKVLKRHRD